MVRSASIAAMIAVAAAAFSGAKILQASALDDRSSWKKVEEYKVLPPANAAPLVYGWMGRQLAADITWVRLVVYYGSSLIGVSDFRYLEQFIDNVIALDPKFRKAYEFGSSAVLWKGSGKQSTVTRKGNEVQVRATHAEFVRSVHYLELAIVQFPDDWELHDQLALRYFLDLQDAPPEERRKHRLRAAELWRKQL